MPIMRMFLCEAQHVRLRPYQSYVFDVADNCAQCRELACSYIPRNWRIERTYCFEVYHSNEPLIRCSTWLEAYIYILQATNQPIPIGAMPRFFSKLHAALTQRPFDPDAARVLSDTIHAAEAAGYELMDNEGRLWYQLIERLAGLPRLS